MIRKQACKSCRACKSCTPSTRRHENVHSHLFVQFRHLLVILACQASFRRHIYEKVCISSLEFVERNGVRADRRWNLEGKDTFARKGCTGGGLSSHHRHKSCLDYVTDKHRSDPSSNDRRSAPRLELLTSQN